MAYMSVVRNGGGVTLSPRHAGPGCTVTNDTGWRQEAENMETLAAGAEPSPSG